MPGNLERRVQVRVPGEAVHRGRPAEGCDIGFQKSLVDAHRRRRARAGHPDLDLQVAAQHPALHRVAQRVLEGIELRRHAEMQVQPAVVHALHADGDLPSPAGLLDAGEARHAARSHEFTAESASRNCSACSRLIDAAAAHQLFVGAHLRDPALVQHHDLVRPADGGQPVRDHDHRAARDQVAQRALHQHLRFGVQVRGGLVQDQDGRVLRAAPGRWRCAAAARRSASRRARRSPCRSPPASPG